MKKRFCAWLLIFSMILSGNIAAFATPVVETVSENTVLDVSSVLAEPEQENVLPETAGDTIVTRIEWLKELNALFEISVEEDNYPDNYYSDVDDTDADYYDIMLATEFGLVDVPAGSAFDKNGVATREFAAHTLNLCLGFIPESETYSFSESASVTYPDDIQAAIEQNWFALSGTSFLPNQAVTSAEKENILALATEVYNEQNNPTVTNTWEFKSSVKVLPEGTKITTISESELSIENCPITIAAGDVFGIVYEDMPFAWKATKVSVSGTVTTITVDVASNEDAFETISVSSEVVADLSKIQPANENIDLDYIVGGTEEEEYEDGVVCESLEEVADRHVSAVLVTETFDIPDAERIKLNVGDAEVKATCKVTGAKMKKGHTANSAYVKFNFTADFNCNVSVDALKASGISPALTLFSVELAPCTLATFTLDLQFYGEANLRLVEEVSLGLTYQNEKFYLTKQFKKKSFTISAQATIQAGVKLTVSFKVPVLSGTLTGKMGVKETLYSKMYADGSTPATCQNISAYFYANIGYSVTADFGIRKKTLASKTIDIFDEYNSPIRVAFHYEDGKEVPKCTRGAAGMGYGGWGYYSPVNSQYYYNGHSSTSTDVNGNTYTIFTYSLNDENKATITGYRGTAVNVFIPDTLDGYEVIAIGASAFSGNTKIKSVSMADTVTKIEGRSFYNCTTLEVVNLPSELEAIESYAFYNCDNLTAIEIPKTITKVTNWAYDDGGPFAECDNLKEVTFASGITNIPDYLFENCPGIESITIPNTITSIGGFAFSECTNLVSIKWSENLTTIKDHAFYKCIGLQEVILPNSVLTIERGAFEENVNVSEVKLPINLKQIDSYAFYNCDNLVAIEIPKTITKVTNWTYDDGGPFAGCDNLKEVTFASGITNIPDYLFENCPGIESITIPNTVTEIGAFAFSECKNLTNVILSTKLVTIKNCGFNKCSSLSNVTIPNTVLALGNSVFEGCTNIIEIALSSKLQEMGSDLFKDCISLKEVSIPDTVTDIGSDMFSGCISLEKVHMPNGYKNIEQYMFYNCTSLSEINLPSILEVVRTYAFYNCDSLTSMNLPSNVNTIEAYAFYDCDKLKSVKISNAVTSMGDYVFQGCEVLSTISLGTGLTNIPSYAFAECPAIKSIVIPYQVTKINNKAFYANTALTEITIPRSVTSIGTEVFSYPVQMTIYGISGTYAETYANNNGITFVNKAVAAETVTLSDSTYTLLVGDLKQLFATVTPSNFTDEVNWKSTNTDVVSVESDGTMQAKGIGTAQIKVTVGNASATCTVTVVQPVTSIYLSDSNLTMEAGETYTLTAEVYPNNANNKLLSWNSSDSSVVSVSTEGLLTAKKKGIATITAEAMDGSGKYDTCEVTVNSMTVNGSTIEQMQSEHPYANDSSDSWIYAVPGANQISVTFSSDTEVEDGFDYIYIYDKNNNLIGKYTGKELAGKTIVIGGDTVRIQLKADDGGNAFGFAVSKIEETSDSNGNNSGNTSESNNGNSSGSNSGNNSNNANGNTGTSPNNAIDKGKVKVTQIELTGISKKIANGKKITLTAKITPSNATNKAVSWKSSNEKYATVNASGVVTTKKAGIGKTVSITATAKDGSGKTATYKIKIMKHKVTSVKLKASKTSVKAGKSVKIKATIKTSGKSVNKTLKWTSSNTKYATVTSKGVVKTKKAGKGKTVTITATSTDGTNKKAKVKIKIK